MKQKKHQEVMNYFMERIFSGTIESGSKLPTEKQISVEMNVDRGSLRVALKQLEAMNVLEIRHGDGMYVKDYLKNAGIDFLGTLFHQRESESEELFRDKYFFDEMWEFWTAVLPGVLELASKRFSIRDVKALTDILDRQESCVENLEELVKLEIQSQDKVAEIVDNTILLLFFNSSRVLRSKMTEIYFRSIGEKELRDYIQLRKLLLLKILSGKPEEIDGVIKTFKDALNATYKTYRESAVGEGGKVNEPLNQER